MAKRILVFPCGSEIGLEIHRSLQYSTHFELVGASSVEDHGRFVFKEYIGGLPFHDHPSFSESLKGIVKKYHIDAIYPAMDAVAETVKNLEREIGTIVIGSSTEVTSLCASKHATYKALEAVVEIPEYCVEIEEIQEFPVFIKPDRGYGARNTLLARDAESARIFASRFKPYSLLFVEYLPGNEWTIDCFSDRHGQLLFQSARSRSRISNGISVHTKTTDEHLEIFSRWAHSINDKIHPRGAWFFQAKLDKNGKPKLLEVAARLGGSSGLFRCKGVNFALLSAFDAFDIDVSVEQNVYPIEMDRALDNIYKIHIDYQHIYVDLDDCLIVRNQVNRQLLCFLYKAISEKKHISLITRHEGDPKETLLKFKIGNIFDRIIHLKGKTEKKSGFIDITNAIFIDDSHAERREVARSHGIPVFAPDMIEALF